MATATVAPIISPVGFQNVGLSAAKTGSSTTGLSASTGYNVKISRDGGALTNIAFTTPSGTQSYERTLPVLNNAIAANAATAGAYFALDAAGDLCCYSSTVGGWSSIDLELGSATDMFATLTSWVGFMPPVRAGFVDVSERYIDVQFGLKFGAIATDTYVTGGLVCSFSGLVGLPPVTTPPSSVVLACTGGGLATGTTICNTAIFRTGPTLATGAVKIYGSNNATTVYKANVEMTNSLALNDATALVNRDGIVGRARWRKGQ